MVEIHFLIVIYFRTYGGEMVVAIDKLGITDRREFTDRVTGRDSKVHEGRRPKGKKKRRRGKGGNSMA